MKKKVPVFVASTLAMSMILGACGSYQKDEQGASAKGESGKANGKQVINMAETQEIPTMDPALSADAVSSRVMNNTMEGLYRLENPVKNQKMVRSILLNYVKMRSGQMENL